MNEGKIVELYHTLYKDEAEYKARYYKNNKVKIAKQRAEYYKNNKVKIAKQKAEYHQENKVKIAKRISEYRKTHKAEYAKRAKDYREKNKELTICECGGKYMYQHNRNRHLKTKKHAKYIDSLFPTP